MQKRPDAIIDIHRDGIPDQSEYTCTIEGDPASQVRLLVGRSNQNSEVNRAFAKQIKAVADKKYPGLIKDIFIGKGNYNQDLSPNAILLEFGTHTLSKERALESTQLMANVVNTALYGQSTGSAKAESVKNKESASAAGKEKNKGILTGIAGLIIAAVLGCVVYALLQTGGGKAMSTKIKRGVSEITGGMLGNKPDKND
ncbi:MAG: stage II sporulation protein P [Clostridia bacterium]|nr:stage II sporulation protein P [Clostridia bacterium]